MGVGAFFHHIGTFFLFAATILLLIASISSPVIDGISILRVDQSTGYYTFGSWGWCFHNNGGDTECSRKMIGYNPAELIRSKDRDIDVSGAGENTSKALTRVMVLHAVGCVLSFIGFILAIGRGTATNFLSSLLSGVAFVVTIIVLATDFAGMAIIHHDANDSNNSSASYGSAIWCVVGAAIALFFATILLFLTCCAGRRKNKHSDTENKVEAARASRRFNFGRKRAAVV